MWTIFYISFFAHHGRLSQFSRITYSYRYEHDVRMFTFITGRALIARLAELPPTDPG